MESVQQGNLDTRVEIRSNDEIGYLAQGMNNMTEKLQGHIKRSILQKYDSEKLKSKH